jgi:hypothetical protein
MKRTHSSPSEPIEDVLVTARRILAAHPVGALFQRRRGDSDELLWVGPVAITPDGRHLVMLSSRFSRVALAVRENPNVSWTFTDGGEEAQVTFGGTAHLADTPGAFAKWSGHLSREARDCLLQYPSHTYGFTAVVTSVESIRISVPSHDIDLTVRLGAGKADHRPRRRQVARQMVHSPPSSRHKAA